MCKENNEPNETIEEPSQAYNPEDGIVFEWWGRAEGLSDEQ